ncbi:hypothetical protein ACS0TY_028320 [Phlomoides rotata]
MAQNLLLLSIKGLKLKMRRSPKQMGFAPPPSCRRRPANRCRLPRSDRIAHSCLDMHMAHWFGLNQSKYQWALDNYYGMEAMESIPKYSSRQKHVDIVCLVSTIKINEILIILHLNDMLELMWLKNMCCIRVQNVILFI